MTGVFLSLLREAKNSLSADSYGKYLETGTSYMKKNGISICAGRLKQLCKILWGTEASWKYGAFPG